MAKLIKITIEAAPTDERADGFFAYFNSKPSKQDCLDAWYTKYKPNSGAIHDLDNTDETGPIENEADPDIIKPGIWKIWLGCYQ